MPRAELNWNPIQSVALQATHRFVDLEGGIRAGKTTPLVAKPADLAIRYPGIHCFLGRWTDDAVSAQLRPAWRDYAAKVGLELQWHGDEQYDEVVGTGSRVYLRGLRASEDSNRYGKFRGLTLAWIGIDQAEEVPHDVFLELAGRLSQPGYPHQLWLTPQPVVPDHWIAKTFPEDNPYPDHLYLRTNVYDNVANVGQAYVDSLEALYPLGSSQRRTLLEGRRGLAGRGDPVYAGYFDRQRHVRPVEMSTRVPLIESWDWGHGHPCVSWSQFWPVGAYVQLGAVMGQAMFLEDFVPAALQYRQRWCPRPLTISSTGDPAGLDVTNQGTRISKVREVLASHGVTPTAIASMNTPEMRYDAIQATGGYMRRMALDGEPAFRLHPRCVVLTADGAEDASFTVDGYEGGYVWSDVVLRGRQTFRVPKKDGYYDHFQNTNEYGVLMHGPGLVTQEGLARVERREERRRQQDRDPADTRMRRDRGRHRVGR
jgi:hypothetical protein